MNVKIHVEKAELISKKVIRCFTHIHIQTCSRIDMLIEIRITKIFVNKVVEKSDRFPCLS